MSSIKFPAQPPTPPTKRPKIMTFLCQAKYLVLFMLVAQNTVYVLLMRYSRTRAGTLYLSSTAVCCDEAVKLVTCLGILTVGYLCGKREGGDGAGRYSQLSTKDADSDASGDLENDAGNQSFRSYLGEQLQFDIRMAGLALFFTVQKNLLYLAISNLDAAVFQVTYQLKVLTTAVFSVVLLKRKLSYQKVAALILLTLSVALVQLDKVEGNAAAQSHQEQRRWVGLLAVLGACCTSGFGGVYFELVLKPHGAEEETRPPPSVWAKNVQLSLFGLIIGLIAAFSKDHKTIMSDGFFEGYDGVVVLVILLQAGGGLIVAAIIKYADNILKSFATGASIATATLTNAWVFGSSISMMFAWGCLLQFVAIWLYSREEGENEGRSAVKPTARTTSSIVMLPSSRSDVEMQRVAHGRLLNRNGK